MTKKQIKNFTAETKSKIILELLREESTISQLSSKYEVSAKSIQSWKKQFLENAPIALEPARAVSEYKAQIQELEQQNDQLAKALGKTTIERDWLMGKLRDLDLQSRKQLALSKSSISMARLCELLNISRSSIYYQPKAIDDYNIQLMHRVDKIYQENPDYGYRFIHKQLLEDGFNVGRDKVLRIMQSMGLQAIYPRKKKSTSNKNKEHKVYKYLLDKYWTNIGRLRTVHVPNINEVWSGDITYVRTNSGFMYFAAILDWHSKAVLSYKLSNSMDERLTVDVLSNALDKYSKPKIFNSDQGSQYTASSHTEILEENNIAISMNGKGRSIDNIVSERFFRTLKYNYLFINNFETIQELHNGIKDYIDKYNYQRFHSSIGYQKPMDVYLGNLQIDA